MDFNLPEELQRRICFALIPAKSLCWPPKLSHYQSFAANLSGAILLSGRSSGSEAFCCQAAIPLAGLCFDSDRSVRDIHNT